MILCLFKLKSLHHNSSLTFHDKNCWPELKNFLKLINTESKNDNSVKERRFIVTDTIFIQVKVAPLYDRSVIP